MTNEEKGAATTALTVEGDAEPVSATARAAGGRRPYSPPRLKSLGSVAELTFVKSVIGTDGPGQKHKTG